MNQTNYLKLLFVTESLRGHGGVQYVARATSEALKVLQPEFTSKTLYLPPGFLNVKKTRSVSYYIAKACIKALNLSRLCIHLNRSRPQFVFFDHLHTARRYARYIKQPFGCWAHLIEFDPELLDQQMMETICNASLFICNSKYTETALHNWHPLILKKTMVCHLGSLHDDVYYSSSADENQIQTYNLLIVGRMSRTERYKGHEQIFHALSILNAKTTKPSWHLHIVGGGDDRSQLAELAKYLEIESKVTFYGELPDDKLEELWQKADAFIMPSSKEGFGLVYLEAMRCGLPLIALKNSVAPEVYGEHGIYALSQDPAVLSNAIESLFNNQWNKSREVRERFYTIFRWTAFLSRFKAIVNEALRIA